jgi:glycerol-1-phosphate dehydrogenase [NAD(P)+]
VVADIDLISQAPPEMTAAGYADLQAKITAGADWVVADALDIEPIEPRAWSIVQGGLRDALAEPARARAGDPAAISSLTEGLMLGGFAMQSLKSSRPASGAEHQFSHLWDMEHHVHGDQAPSHGFKVGVATLAIAALYEQLVQQPLDQLDVDQCCARWPEPAEAEARVQHLFVANDFLSTALTEIRTKHPSRAELRTRLDLLRRRWPKLCDDLRTQLVPHAELKRRLQLVGAPTEPEEIGLTRERLRASFFRAYHIRRRYTVLDLAVQTGLLDPLLDALFGAGGIWQIPSSPPLPLESLKP